MNDEQINSKKNNEEKNKSSMHVRRDAKDKYAFHVKVINEQGNESNVTILTMGRCIECL